MVNFLPWLFLKLKDNEKFAEKQEKRVTQLLPMKLERD